jgi:hypothetical protein
VILSDDFAAKLQIFDLESGRQLTEISRVDFEECNSDYDRLLLCHNDELLIGSHYSQIDFFDAVEGQLKIPPIKNVDLEENSMRESEFIV